jgi:Na+-transporting methylmalonyl-CoA/oxaloacetate decarboxylase gamma subunit
MSEQFALMLVVVAIILLALSIGAATVAFVHWDTRRRNLPGRQQFKWVLLTLVPLVGLIAYLINRSDRSEPSVPKKRVTMLKPVQATDRRLPTIAAAEFAQVARDMPELAVEVGQMPTPVLTVTKGPHRGQEFVIDKLPALIGRVDDAAVRLDQDIGVSRRHAELYQQQGVLRLRDLDSAHGTRVNEQAISDVDLAPGDTICAGISFLLVKEKWKGR